MRLGLIPLLNEYYTSNKIFAANGLGYIASYLEKHIGYTDLFLEMNPQKMIEAKPDIMGISTITENYSKAIRFSKEVKEKLNIPVMIGGVHITSLPHTLPSTIDVGILSEGEETSAELMSLFLKEGSLPIEKLKDIDGICFHDENGNVVINKKRHLTKDLDSLPAPNRHLVKNKDGFWTQSILTSRGCPFDCIYCSAIKLWDGVRFHSPERVISDIEDIIRHFPDQFMVVIDDDLFAMNPKRLEKIVELIKEEKIDKKVCFSCQGRSSNFTDRIARLLKEMNVKLVTFGFESVIDRVLGQLKGDTANNDKNMRAINLCEKYDMDAVACFITDTYMETKNEAARTYWILKEQSDRLHPHFFHMTPLPATPTWHYAKKRGLVDDFMDDWSVFNINYNDKSIFLNENYTREEFEKEIYPTLLSLTHPEFYLDIDENVKNNIEIQGRKKKEEDYRHYLEQKVLNIFPSLAKNVFQITNKQEGLEKQKTEIDIISQKVTNGDVDILDIDEKTLDLIYMDHTIELLRDPVSTLSNLSKYLKKNHYLLINIYNSLNLEIMSNILNGTIKYNSKVYPNNQFHFMTRESIKKLLEKSGFSILNMSSNNMSNVISNPTEQFLSKYLNFANQDLRKEADIISYTILAQN